MADEQESEMIRQQMQLRRAALDEKLETLENKLVQTVDDAREAVAETVQTVKEGVHDSMASVKDTVVASVATVKETFDLERHVQRHPWPMFAGAVAAGFVAGCLLRRSTAASPRQPTIIPGPAQESPAAPRVPPSERSERWMDMVARLFAPELRQLKGLAIGTLMGVLRDLVTDPLPETVRPQLNEIADSITTKLGGQPIQSEVLHELLPGHDDHHNGRRRAEPEPFRA
jgi:ElaB/YqjD/DUF883 family membrane-anchored ribosome-binding protein